MVPFARRVRTIRLCSLDARGLGPIQATLLKASNKLLLSCLGKARPWAKKLSWQTQGGRVRSLAFLSILRGRCPLVPDVRPSKFCYAKMVFRSLLKRKVQLDSAIYPIVKCLRVLIAAFERQVKALDWHLN